MLEIMQVYLIADRLLDHSLPVIRDGELDEPWQTVFQRVQPLDETARAEDGYLERVLWKATAGLPDRNQIVERVLAVLPEDLERIPSLADVAADLPPVRWLWPGWIPQGMLSILGAAPGAGKSLVALDLARRTIHGEPFPGNPPDADSIRSRPGGTVVYVDAEALPQVQNQRALAWGMDRSLLFPMLPPERYGCLDFGDVKHQDHLVEMCYRLRPELVIVDSLSSISLKGENNVEDVRALLRFLNAVAHEFDVAVLLIHHLRKRARMQPGPFAGPSWGDLVTADDFRGSSHIIAMARSVLALSVVQAGPRPDANGPRRLEVLKAILCRCPPALGVVFESPPDGAPPARAGEVVAPSVRYTDPPKPYRRPTQVDECAAWIQELLRAREEPVRPAEVYALAEAEGFNRNTVYRARKALAGAVLDTDKWRSPNNRWKLAGDE
jgi:putative DNA primase/helicase